MIRDQFFSSFEEGDPQPRISRGARISIGNGPIHSATAKTNVGFTGARALRYAANGFTRIVLFEVSTLVTERTELSYVVFPVAKEHAEEDADGERDSALPTYRSTYVSLDIEFEDGSTFSGLGGADHHGVPMTALDQGQSKSLYLDQWNHIRCDLGALAAGKTTRAIILTVDTPPGSSEATGWLDDVRITARAPRSSTEPLDYVRTTRGTHSGEGFSRGNTFPATAIPHGFNFWTPLTDASSLSWPYQYHRHNDSANRPALEGFGLSHQPSPWMGDRHTFHVMPGLGSVTADRKQRALTFTRDEEIDKPHHYGVRFDNGITVDIAPSDHAALFRFRFPSVPGHLVFDNVDNRGNLHIDPLTRTVSGHTWTKSRLSAGARRMYIYAIFDRPAVSGGKLATPWRKVTGHLVFDSFEVNMRIATSLISLTQAKRNLALEIPPNATFEIVSEQAKARWRELLGRIEIEGGTEDQLTTFYSNLYRLFLYPNSGYESVGTAEKPRYQHASPVIRSWRPSTKRKTGAKLVDGKIMVNNGFWDTYRTTWPAYALLTPAKCGELIDGFVQHYREGGWISRWSSPGYADLMTGTSSDVAFADAYLKEVRGFDVDAAYDAALRNATVSPTNKSVGRKGLHESIFTGYTNTSTPEGLSWSLENCVNDFGLALFSQARYEQSERGNPRRREYLDNARYFRQRALNYGKLFDSRVNFFQGRDEHGNWRCSPSDFDPEVWGFDYTETNAWNMLFSVPHDGRGLANLLGGKVHLESTLDKFFATPETGVKTGSYGKVTHEMTEARDIRLGQHGHSNQPSHHIPYMYNYAGAPSKTQAIVREILRRCYLGSEIGQGYPGDEDNGEMSAWYVFSALGLYPLSVGSPQYAIGSPLFTKATIHWENGKDLVINAPENSERAVYVRGLAINGVPHPATSLSHETLMRGGVLNFDMTETPSAWGRDSTPPSLTKDDALPDSLVDAEGSCYRMDGSAIPELVDNTTRTQVTFSSGSSATPVIGWTARAEQPPTVLMYTLTSGARRGDPRSWTLAGSNDGTQWTVIDERNDQTFLWRQQTRPFSLSTPGTYRHYRLRITSATDRRVTLSQWELLAMP